MPIKYLTSCVRLEDLLDNNLKNLTAIAELAQTPPSGPSQVPSNSVARQGYSVQPPQGTMMQQVPRGAMMQQPPEGAMKQQQQQGSAGVLMLPKANAYTSQDYYHHQQQQQQQQLLHFQQQQQIYSQMAIRAGANNGIHGMNQILQNGPATSGSLMDTRGMKKDSSEAASGSNSNNKFQLFLN
ncbi:uncharacterized protein LOC141672786 [Apium graveolens]|uniref:uncharacterized protein LOC141672786 n=1 Tax=Apium graveolens TaxID=4045 RepID=UPI003D7990FD